MEFLKPLQKGLINLLFTEITSLLGILIKFWPGKGIESYCKQAAANTIYNFLGSFCFTGRQQWCLGKNCDGIFVAQNIMCHFLQQGAVNTAGTGNLSTASQAYYLLQLLFFSAGLTVTCFP